MALTENMVSKLIIIIRDRLYVIDSTLTINSIKQLEVCRPLPDFPSLGTVAEGLSRNMH